MHKYKFGYGPYVSWYRTNPLRKWVVEWSVLDLDNKEALWRTKAFFTWRGAYRWKERNKTNFNRLYKGLS